MTMRRRLMLPFLVAVFVLAVSAPIHMGYQAYAEGGEVNKSDEDPDAKPEGTPATSELQTVDEDGNPVKCRDLEEAKGGVLISKIVPCMLRTVETTTSKFSAKVVTWLRPLLYAFLTLVVVLYGLRVLQNEPEIHKHGILLLLKVALVLTVLDKIPDYYVPKTYSIMSESVSIVTNVITTENLNCKDVSEEYKGPKVWAIMDCVLGKLYGFTSGTNGQPNMLLKTSMFGLLSGFLFGGSWGVAVFFAMVGVLVSVLMLVIRTTLAFISSYLTISILLILCPLFVPLVFLRGTSGYFEKMWRSILGAFLMPVIVTAYAMMALLVYDKILFADGSLMKVLFDHNKIAEALEKPKKACDHPITVDASDVRFQTKPTEDVMNKVFLNPFLKNTIVPTLSGANDPCTMTGNMPVFNLKSVKDEGFKKGRETYLSLFSTLVQLLVLGWLVSKGQGQVQSIIPNLTSSGAAAIALGAQSMSDFKLTGAAKEAKDTFSAGVSGTQGADFLKAVPGAGKDAFKSFMGGVRR